MKKNRIWAQFSESLLAVVASTAFCSLEEAGAIKAIASLHNADVNDVTEKVIALREKREAQKAKAPVPEVVDPSPVALDVAAQAEAMAAAIDADLEDEDETSDELEEVGA